MKHLFVACILVASSFSFATAQSFAYVDTEFILQKMPEYKKAQEQLDKTVESWNKEIQQRYKEIDDMYKRFQAEQVLLSPSEKAQREQDIIAKEKEARELQKQKFGSKGDLFQKKQDLVRPIQDQVYAAIETLANKRKYDFVLDKSSGVAILFANPKFDITNDVLKELGI